MYLAKPPGYKFMNFAKPISGIVYLYVGLFGNANEIDIVLIAFQTNGKTHVAG